MSGTCDYCKARLSATDKHRVPIPRSSGDDARARPELHTVTYWNVHERCVAHATEHLRFELTNRRQE